MDGRDSEAGEEVKRIVQQTSNATFVIFGSALDKAYEAHFAVFHIQGGPVGVKKLLADDAYWIEEDVRMPEPTTVRGAELIMGCKVNWDGCVNFYTGKSIKERAYVHICGRDDFKELGEVFAMVFDMANLLLDKDHRDGEL